MLTFKISKMAAGLVAGGLVLALAAGAADAQCYSTYGYSSYYTPGYSSYYTPYYTQSYYAQPAYVAPPPVFVAPAPVIYAPSRVYYSTPAYRTYGFGGYRSGGYSPYYGQHRSFSFGFGFGSGHGHGDGYGHGHRR
jgi:hypothetical protein